MINFKSESANKTQQNNAKILFGSKGVSILTKLEEYNKEKVINTAGISALLEVLKTKDTALLEKFASSKTGKTLSSNCKKLASAKTFNAVVTNIKAIKPLKSFDKFTSIKSEPRAKTPARPNAPASPTSKPVVDLNDIYDNLDASQDYEDITDDFNRLVGSNVQVVEMAADGGDNEALSVSIKGGTAYFLPAGQAPSIAKKLGISGKKDAIYVDSYKNHGPFNGTPDPIPGTIIESRNPAQKKAMLKQFTSWVKNGVPKSAVTSSFDVTNPSTYASLLDQQADTSVAQYRKTQKQIVSHIRKLGRIPNSWDINLEEDAADVDGYFLEINPKSKNYSGDMHVICLGGVSSQDPDTKKWAPKGNTVAVIEQIDGVEYGEVKRMDFAKALKYVVAKNK